MAKRSKHQQKIIRNYYQNREAIGLQRAQELATELYLSSGKKRVQNWNRVAKHLQTLGVKQSQIDHLVEQDNPELLVKLVERLMNQES